MSRQQLQDDAGSLAPLGIGLALVSLSTILIFTSVSSMFLFQRRVTTLAEFAALSGARYDFPATDFLRRSGAREIKGMRVAVDIMKDGLTREVTVCAKWQAPVAGFVELLELEICGQGAARAG